MKKMIITLLLFVSCNSYSEEVLEHWTCTEHSWEHNLADALVEAQVMKGRTHGKIYVAGVTYDTVFKVNGFNRRWDFGDDYKFAFIIEPNGDAYYYDFSRKSKIKLGMRLHCVQKQNS